MTVPPSKEGSADSIDRREIAMDAMKHMGYGYDEYSGTKVGASLEVVFRTGPQEYMSKLYGGSNLTFSGLQPKIHAEQLALFNAITSIQKMDNWEKVEFSRLALHISTNELYPPCGSCLQALKGVTGDMRIIGVKCQEMYDSRGKPDGVDLAYEVWSLDELMGDTYVEEPLVDKRSSG